MPIPRSGHGSCGTPPCPCGASALADDSRRGPDPARAPLPRPRAGRRVAAVRNVVLRGVRAARSARLPCARRIRPRRAIRLVLHRLGAPRDDVRRHPLRLLVPRQPAVPLRGRRRVSRLLSPRLRRDRAPATEAGLDLQREPLARWAHRRDRRRCACRVGARRGRRQLDPRKPFRRVDQHGLSDRGRAPARPHRLRLPGDALASGSCLVVDRRRNHPQRSRRCGLPLRNRCRHLRRGDVHRPHLAGSRSFSSRSPPGSSPVAFVVSSFRTAR